MASPVHISNPVNRKILIVLAALIVPGGFIALFGAWLLKALSRTERGRKVIDFARDRVPVFAPQPRPELVPARQVA